MFAAPLPWSQLVRQTAKESKDDDLLGLAAQLAYYFFLALFPAILVLLAAASYFPLGRLTDDIGSALGPFVSPQVLELIQDQMRRLASDNDGGLLTFGMLGALWSSSAALVAIVSALNQAYDIEEGRTWWKVRLVAIGLTVVTAICVLCALSLVLAGPALSRYLAEMTGLGPAFEWGVGVFGWILALTMVVLAIGLVYYFAPDAEQDWVWVTPGAIVATVLWMLVSIGFKVYIANFTDYTGSYGTVGGVIVLLLWFYVSSLAILVGAELNAEIEHASPYGKPPGQKTLAGRRVIGPRAAREFDRLQPGVPGTVDQPFVKPQTSHPGES